VDDGDAAGKERRIGASWIFEGHYYRAEYRSHPNQLEMIEIRMPDERGGTSWSPVRTPRDDPDIEKEKVEIGKALLKESVQRAEGSTRF
jgi:hypothetical protein